MAITQRSAISFGLVHIPVELYTATQDNDIRFNQLVRDNMERVHYKKTCPSCKKELTNSDIVKGFQYEKDRYVVVTDEDLEKIKTEKDRSIQIFLFTKAAAVPPVYFDRSYFVLPEKGGEKAFELLRQAMLDEGKAAIGKTVMGNHETLLLLLPEKDGIQLITLHYYDEIKTVPRAANQPKPGKAELDMAKQLIDAMEAEFHPEEYKDEYQSRLRALIEQKIEGQEIVAPKEQKEDNIVDLMEALKASLGKSHEGPKRKKKGA